MTGCRLAEIENRGPSWACFPSAASEVGALSAVSRKGNCVLGMWVGSVCFWLMVSCKAVVFVPALEAESSEKCGAMIAISQIATEILESDAQWK